MLPPLGEDEASVQQHVQAMAAEVNRADKVHPSAELLIDRQKRTLAARSDDLKRLTTIDLIRKYPWLNLPRMVRINS